MFYTLIYKIIKLIYKEKPIPAMIQAGKIIDSKIEENHMDGGILLDVEELKNTSVKNNKVKLPSPKEIFWFWKAFIDLTVLIIGGFILYKTGWNGLQP